MHELLLLLGGLLEGVGQFPRREIAVLLGLWIRWLGVFTTLSFLTILHVLLVFALFLIAFLHCGLGRIGCDVVLPPTIVLSADLQSTVRQFAVFVRRLRGRACLVWLQWHFDASDRVFVVCVLGDSSRQPWLSVGPAPLLGGCEAAADPRQVVLKLSAEAFASYALEVDLVLILAENAV